MRHTKYEFEYVKQCFDNKNYELISTEYMNNYSHLEFICNKHRDKGIQKVKFTYVLQAKNNCKCCDKEDRVKNGSHRVKKETILKICKNFNYTFVDMRILESYTEIDFICKQHEDEGIQTITSTKLSTRQFPCNFCKKEYYINNAKVNFEPYIIKEEDIIDKCKLLNLIYVDGDKTSNGQYVSFLCPKHTVCGEQSISYYQLDEKRICCTFCKNDSYIADIKKEPLLNTNIEILGEYVDSKIKCKCKVCEYEWMAYPSVLRRGGGCLKCAQRNLSKTQKDTQIEFESKLYKMNPNITVAGEYTGARNKIKCKCNIHNIKWESVASCLTNGSAGCPLCNGSVGERRIAAFLSESNIEFIAQFMFDDCVYKNKLRFDFYVPQFNICIEFQGEQHYFFVDFHNEGVDYNKVFETIKTRDNIKRNYCQDNNIPLIEIPYWERNNIDAFLSNELSKLNLIYQSA